MAFLKFINETITYPYNTKTDYPYTGFPPGTDYPEFNVYWVYPTSPNPPENNSATEGTPAFSAELNRWEQTWTYAPIAPSPDWIGFNTAMLNDAAWGSWAIPADVRTAIISAAVAELPTQFATAYSIAKSLVPPTAEAVAGWQAIADTYSIPVTF